MDTQNDGLEKVDSFEIWPFLVSILDFWGVGHERFWTCPQSPGQGPGSFEKHEGVPDGFLFWQPRGRGEGATGFNVKKYIGIIITHCKDSYQTTSWEKTRD